MNRLTAILLLAIAALCRMEVPAATTGEDIDQTIVNLYQELRYNQNQTDQELALLQQSREQYWDRIVDLQKQIDRAMLVLYAQDGGSLFSVGLASEQLSQVCSRFDREKVPFANWLQAMTVLSNRHTNIKRALEQVHTQHLQPATLGYISRSIQICDSLDARFGCLRDSIALDQQRYEKLAAEIHQLEDINRQVVSQIRSQIFQDNDLDLITAFSSFNYSDLDFYYNETPQGVTDTLTDSDARADIDHYNLVANWIALLLAIGLAIALRLAAPRQSQLRSKRWYYAIVLYLAVLIVGGWLTDWSLSLSSYLHHVNDVMSDFNFFMLWMVLSATLRLKRPGLGWSVAVYVPLFLLGFILLDAAIELTRSLSLKTLMPFLFILVSIVTLVIGAVGLKRFRKADYPAVFSCIGLVLGSTLLVLMGYYYPAFILVLFVISIMTYLSALVCIKHLFAKRIRRAGPIMRLTLSHLIYPTYYIYAIVQSLNDVANVFNLRTWLADLITTPFVSFPEFGIISASRIILLIVVGLVVNYLIRLTKLLLIRIDKDKFETGSHAVSVTLGTMLVWFGYGIFGLIVLQINHSGVIAAIGGASLGLSFAMKETLENLISGLQLMSSRARPGDLVQCDSARGVIKHIGILSTQIQVEDGPIVSFPNRQLMGSTFTNLTLNHRREIRHIVFDIAADSDLALAKELMLEASRGIDGVVDHDRHYVVMRCTNSGLVRLDYKCWIDSALYLRAEPAVREAIFRAFRAHGIQIADLPASLGLHLTGTVLPD